MTGSAGSPFFGDPAFGKRRETRHEALRALARGEEALVLADLGPEAPAPPPPAGPQCACGATLGAGDRARYGHCGRCAGRYPNLTTPRCWCGRRVSTLPNSNGTDCAEHDGPLPALSGPSEPLTPGGILDPHYP